MEAPTVVGTDAVGTDAVGTDAAAVEAAGMETVVVLGTDAAVV